MGIAAAKNRSEGTKEKEPVMPAKGQSGNAREGKTRERASSCEPLLLLAASCPATATAHPDAPASGTRTELSTKSGHLKE